MKKNLKILIIIICLIVLLYFFIQKNNQSQNWIPSIETWVLSTDSWVLSTGNWAITYNYINKEKSFSLQVPSMRTFKESILNSLVIFFAPQWSWDNIKENLWITSDDLTWEIYTWYTGLDTYYNQTMSLLENVINDFQLVSKEEIQVDNQNAITIIYNGTVENRKLRREQVFFIKWKTVYIFTYTAPQDTFYAFSADVNNIINSFSL